MPGIEKGAGNIKTFSNATRQLLKVALFKKSLHGVLRMGTEARNFRSVMVYY